MISFYGITQQKYIAVPITQVPAVPDNIVADESHVYWSNLGYLEKDGSFNIDVINGSIMRTNLDGSNIETLASGLYPSAAITIDNNYVYWIASDGVMKVPKNGGAIIKLVAWQAPSKESSAVFDREVAIYGDVAVDDGFVYWVKCGADAQLAKVDKNGGQPIILVSGQYCPTDLEIDDKNVYWLDYGVISKITKEGTNYQKVIDNQAGATSIAIDKDYLYWANEISFTGTNDNQVLRIPLSGGKPTVIFRGYFRGIHNLKVYTSNLYWIKSPTVGDGILMKSEKNGNSVKKLTTAYAPYLSNRLAINSKGVFFVDVANRRIYFVEQ